MSWGAFFITLPVNMIIIWCIKEDIATYNKGIKELGRAYKF